jgi:hypothetical protein
VTLLKPQAAGQGIRQAPSGKPPPAGAATLGHPDGVDPSRSHRFDVADDTFVAAAPDVLAAAVHDEAAWGRWWPDLHPVVTRDRGLKGLQWSVTGALVGSMEIWLEPWGDGVVLHWYLRADHAGSDHGGSDHEPTRGYVDRRVRHWKRHVHALKDRLEVGRVPGTFAPAVKEGPRPADPT